MLMFRRLTWTHTSVLYTLAVMPRDGDACGGKMKYSLASGPRLYVNTNVYYWKTEYVLVLVCCSLNKSPKCYTLGLLNATHLRSIYYFHSLSTKYYVYPIGSNAHRGNRLSFNSWNSILKWWVNSVSFCPTLLEQNSPFNQRKFLTVYEHGTLCYRPR